MMSQAARVLLLVLAMGALAALPVRAEVSSTAPAVPAQVQKPAANIDGFRSAKFGMDEAALRRAIYADFGVREDKVKREVHPVEKTTVLSIAVINLLPDSGSAVVSYILGYQTHKLFHVNVVWASGKEAELGAVAITLRNYFAGMAFPENSVVANRQFQDGSFLAFQGTDKKGRTVTLIYHPQPKPAKDEAPKAEAPKDETALRLSYIENPAKPDIFTVEPGKF